MAVMRPDHLTNRAVRLASVLALVFLFLFPVGSPLATVVKASDDSTPGPCQPGYVAPTPTPVAVTGVPIVVDSTTADYFVLYIKHPNTDVSNYPSHSPISLTRGQAGTTTLADNLKPLSADKYKVEKYQVAQPADIDGDCIDDITELASPGTYHPLNPARKLPGSVGAVAIPTFADYQALSTKQANPLASEDLRHIEFVKFTIINWASSNPSVYFLNTNNNQHHAYLGDQIRKAGVGDFAVHSALKGNLAYHPNVIAPDGSLGMYRFVLFVGPSYGYVAHLHQVLATAMPFLDNNLAFYPSADRSAMQAYEASKARYAGSRVNVLLQEDVLPDVDFIPLNQAAGYGLLRLMGEGDDPRPGDIPIYESLPNDLPRVAGSITTVPQTPLSHVNLRAIQNGAPNAFLRDILTTKKYKDLIGKHVYFLVASDRYVIREATKAEVDAHHAKLRPAKTQTLTRDLTETKIKSLSSVAFDDWTAFGVKAANMAELSNLGLPAGVVPTGYAVPFYFYDEFMKANGFWVDVDKMLADEKFQSDYGEQEKQLKALRKKIKKGTTPAWIIKALEDLHANYPDGTSLRYRSSTNNEDLPAFNGAGLYDSKTQDPDETEDDGIDKSIKGVWASLWNYRAFLERDYYRVDHRSVAMGVLVHPNFSDELANGVAVSYDPINLSPKAYYVNTQVGEDLVTNPEAKSYPEQILLDAKGKPTVLERSNLAKPGKLLMTDAQMVALRKHLKTIHDRFAVLYGAEAGEDFAIEIEFKITAANKLAIKQARPWVFGQTIAPNPKVSLKFEQSPVIEGSPVELVVSRSGGALSNPLTVELVWSGSVQKLVNAPPTSVRLPANKNSLKLSLATSASDSVDPDGVLTAKIKAGGAYDIVAPASATATVKDIGPPKVSVSGGGGITEGEAATFTISADRAPRSALTVPVTVSQSGDYAASGAIGSFSVTPSPPPAVRPIRSPPSTTSTMNPTAPFRSGWVRGTATR